MTKIEESHRIVCKLIYLLKRYMDDWINSQLCCGCHNFNNAHLPLFMSIGSEGISNNALAEKLNVTKQATSKIIKELESINLVTSQKSKSDARAVTLCYTEEGKQFYNSIVDQIYKLEAEYKKIVGAKNYEIAIDVMMKLIDFHDHLPVKC
ncbi:MarR family winged helix-turn-helix transcriptional regulator [Mucilaginibacter sp. KACC 22063]|uniref:MarR family winged helix-turn-helix transcriptional regulator n=1 Tax=Mucilaginibacter sp. KACC 22063 TaxID=3025666 RepID=UPI002365F7EA|nr:MarR family winged helix-turn-helix transcriptional regulator [Mucilaginibacter sp. KACC 22063]WDF56771.1 MarR family winged helix-turn-helix transcriptional regulator [Mucilaginibacter sp. KACC 22063]